MRDENHSDENAALHRTKTNRKRGLAKQTEKGIGIA